jgi:serine/threonine protein kinase
MAANTRRSLMNAAKICIIICGIGLGMRSIHLSGVIHRDLNPSNILLNERLHPLIADFGSAHFQSDDATPLPESGTVYYAAPEQYQEDAVPTPKIDVFSFGLILYELLVGSPVFPSSVSVFDVIRRLRNRDLPRIPASCGFVMEDLIGRCWKDNPDDRLTFHQILWEFQCHGFSILPYAAPNELQDFCDAILDWERKAGIPQ